MVRTEERIVRLTNRTDDISSLLSLEAARVRPGTPKEGGREVFACAVPLVFLCVTHPPDLHSVALLRTTFSDLSD